MITNLTTSIIGGLKGALKIVFLVMALIALVRWAQHHPAQAQQLANKLMATAANIVNWALDQITALTN